MDRAYAFGPGRGLIGVLTTPDSAPARGDSPTVILLNAGLVHHVGPHRLYVELARQLAALGFSVFRFDLSGIGDSEPPRREAASDDQPVADIFAAMNFLEAKARSRTYVLMGLCSGADNSHRLAVADERVVGAVLLDGYAYGTLGYYARYYWQGVLRPDRGVRFIKRKLAALLNPGEGEAMPGFARSFPPKKKIERELEQLVARGVRLYFIYSGGVDYYLYQRQFTDMFPSVRNGMIRVDYFREANHTYSLLEHRAKLIDAITRWLSEAFVTDRDWTDARGEQALTT